MKKLQRPLKLAICSWAVGIGGGVARMESYYQSLYDKSKFEVELLSLIKRDPKKSSFNNSLDFTQIDTKNRFQDLVSRFRTFDIVQFQGCFDPLVCEAAKLAGVPLLVEVIHNIEQGALFDNIDATICVSQIIKDRQKKEAESKVILNGIDLNAFPYKPKIRDKNQPVTILQIGRRSKVEVNLDEIASDIHKVYPDTEFLICGDEQTLLSTTNVEFLGVRGNINELYNKADIFILLSKEEPFGLVALEAMASGTPVVTSAKGGFLEFIENDINGYLIEAPLKQNAIEVILKLIKDIKESKSKHIIINARKSVELNYDIRNTIRSYEEYILELYDKKIGLDVTIPNRQDNFAITPPNSLVGEALYDFHELNFSSLSERLKELSLCVYPITERHCLKMAHDLSQYIKLNFPDKLPAGIFPYLYYSGDKTEKTLIECIKTLDIIKSRDLFEKFKQDWREFLKNHSQPDPSWPEI